MSSFDRSEIFIYSPRLSVFLQLPDSTSGDGEKKGKIQVWFEAAQEIAGLCPKRAGCSCCVPGTGLCRFLPLGPCLCCFSEPKLQRKAAWKNPFAVVVLLVSGLWRNASFFSFLKENHSMRRLLG